MKINDLNIKDGKLNICQVSLKGNIPIILENYKRFKSYYNDINFFIICPSKEIKFFKKKIKFSNVFIISEEEVISHKKFRDIFIKRSKNYKFKNLFKSRLPWYYQQILKLSFSFYFISKFNQKIILWDADTIITKKITFFNGEYSRSFGSYNEFHLSYFNLNKKILGKIPKYFISSIVQFVPITQIESNKLFKKLRLKEVNLNSIAFNLSIRIFKKIFEDNYNYNGSLFSEYELVGMSNLILKPKAQKLLATMRKGLSGCFNTTQLNLLGYLNISNVTYEHTYNNRKSAGMLNRKISWLNFFLITFKTLLKFYYNSIRHHIFFVLDLDKMKKIKRRDGRVV
tara:strand:- start:22 stop:1044 length:1023 start_codon:yes stop_codon:yes gene_type:complete